MAIDLDSDDSVRGRKTVCDKVASGSSCRTRTRRGNVLNTIAVEGIARLRAQILLDANKTVMAVRWLRHANMYMVRNNLRRIGKQRAA